MSSQAAVSTGFIISRYSRDLNGTTEISYWLATDGLPVRLVVQNEMPVFFINEVHFEHAAQLLSSHQIAYTHKPLALSTFQHQHVVALYFSTLNLQYRALDVLKSVAIETFESDIKLHERFLMERFVCGSAIFTGEPINRHSYIEYRNAKLKPAEYTPTLKVISLDIECSMQGELYSIGLYANDFQVVIMIGQPQDSGTPIIWVDNELGLLNQLEAQIREYDPDVIIGWNVINFDFALLFKRAEKYNKRLQLGRGKFNAHWRTARNDSSNGFVTLPGRVVIDGIDALKTATHHFESFSLEFVSRHMLNRGKLVEDVHNRVEHITHDFLHNKPKLAAYNLEDCKLVVDIFEHTKLLEFLIFRSQLTGLEVDRVGGSVAAFTHLYLPKLHRAGYIAPNLPADGGLASPGGYVMNSIPGLYRNVLVLDFKSLYPSIIRTFKVDPLGLVEGLAEKNNHENPIEGFKGAKFSRENHFLPDIITSLWQQRDQAKKDKDAARSQAIKILMNSFYGVLGSGGCRFYDTRLASSITMRGHQIMQQTAKWIEEQGHTVIYGDTDSTFVLVNEDFDAKQCEQVGNELATLINDNWHAKLENEFQLPCHLEIEFETHYRRFLMPTIRGAETGSKKRYAGIIGEGDAEQLIFKGLETVRSDWTHLAREFQTTLYQKVFHDLDPSAYITKVIKQIKNGEFDKQLVYRKRLRRKLHDYVKNVPPHVKAARLADKRNEELGRPLQYQNKGWISYIITINGPEPIEHLQSNIDYDHYIAKQIEPIADGILSFIGQSFDQIGNDQMGLF